MANPRRWGRAGPGISWNRGGIDVTALQALVLSVTLVVPFPTPPQATGPRAQPPGASSLAATDPKPAASQGNSGKPAAKSKPAASATRPAAGKNDAGPRVRTQAEMQKPRSPFLSPPTLDGAEADRYNPGGPDWSEIPPWRQTSFFGLRAAGRFFIYVIDGSGSMIDDDRFPRATIELRRSVLALQAPQQFEVIFYNNESIPMPGGPRPRPADPQNKSQFLAWLSVMEPDSGTEPRPAMRQALSLRPDAVFLLSDGEFPRGTAEEIARVNTRRIPIHCVDLSGGLAGDQLRRIAHDSGGQYASRPGSLHGTP
jgi:hypothetical protein